MLNGDLDGFIEKSVARNTFFSTEKGENVQKWTLGTDGLNYGTKIKFDFKFKIKYRGKRKFLNFIIIKKTTSQ